MTSKKKTDGTSNTRERFAGRCYIPARCMRLWLCTEFDQKNRRELEKSLEEFMDDRAKKSGGGGRTPAVATRTQVEVVNALLGMLSEKDRTIKTLTRQTARFDAFSDYTTPRRAQVVRALGLDPKNVDVDAVIKTDSDSDSEDVYDVTAKLRRSAGEPEDKRGRVRKTASA